MKNVLLLLALVVSVSACQNKSDKDKFTITGQIKHAPNQKIYLEELFFSEHNPEVLDTADMKYGQFTLSTIAAQEGLYRLRMEKSEAFFIVINDQNNLTLSADLNQPVLENGTINSAANASLKQFISGVQTKVTAMDKAAATLGKLLPSGKTDSAYQATKKSITSLQSEYNNFIVQYIDTTKDAVVALFAVGYSRDIAPEKLEKSIAGLSKRFPTHAALNGIVAQYNQMMSKQKAKPHEGGMAPEINMPDTSGKNFALSMLKGKYVLVDFWASWCGPCRGENPNVVKAFNAYKDKNFTVLGVSLDDNKASWIKAIKADGLNWYHISDLKQWSSAAVGLYGFDGIPYNVLVDPTGKIIAINLRGDALEQKLSEVIL